MSEVLATFLIFAAVYVGYKSGVSEGKRAGRYELECEMREIERAQIKRQQENDEFSTTIEKVYSTYY